MTDVAVPGQPEDLANEKAGCIVRTMHTGVSVRFYAGRRNATQRSPICHAATSHLSLQQREVDCMIIGVLSVLADWNMVRDVDEQGRPVLRVLKPDHGHSIHIKNAL